MATESVATAPIQSQSPLPQNTPPPQPSVTGTTAQTASSLAIVPQITEDEDEEEEQLITAPKHLRDVAEMFKQRQEMLIYSQIYSFISPIKFEDGNIEIYLDPAADRTIPGQLSNKLHEWTGKRWIVSVVSENKKTKAHITLSEEDKRAEQQKLANAARHPIVEEVLEHFPGAKITKIEDITS